MKFQLINMADYPRREAFERFYKMQCCYSLTIQFDITKIRKVIKERGIRLYPALI